jgi:hypothetical protein
MVVEQAAIDILAHPCGDDEIRAGNVLPLPVNASMRCLWFVGTTPSDTCTRAQAAAGSSPAPHLVGRGAMLQRFLDATRAVSDCLRAMFCRPRRA